MWYLQREKKATMDVILNPTPKNLKPKKPKRRATEPLIRPNSESPFTTVLKGVPLFFFRNSKFLISAPLRCLTTVFSEKLCLVKFGSRTECSIYSISLLNETNNSVQPRSTLKLNLLDQQSTTTSYGLQSFIYVAPQVWNTLPDDIRTSETLIAFKRAIRNITVWCRYIYFVKTRIIICACVVILYFPTFLKSDFYTRRY